MRAVDKLDPEAVVSSQACRQPSNRRILSHCPYRIIHCKEKTAGKKYIYHDITTPLLLFPLFIIELMRKTLRAVTLVSVRVSMRIQRRLFGRRGSEHALEDLGSSPISGAHTFAKLGGAFPAEGLTTKNS